MAGRPKIICTPEELKELQKKPRAKYKKYHQLYSKYHYLKKVSENPNYNQANYSKKKLTSGAKLKNQHP